MNNIIAKAANQALFSVKLKKEACQVSPGIRGLFRSDETKKKILKNQVYDYTKMFIVIFLVRFLNFYQV